MDKYIRTVKILEDAFDQIKEATGIASTQEIVTTFIKAEEQNYSLYNYVNMLNTEIDTIEEQNKTISNEIRKHEMKGDLSEKEKQQAIEDLKAEIDAANENMMAKEGKNKEMEDKLLKMQKNVEVG